jgi:transposase
MTLPESEKRFILDNYKTKSAIQMAKILGRSNSTVYAFLDEKELKAYRSRFGLQRGTRPRVKDGYFDESAHIDWMVG